MFDYLKYIIFNLHKDCELDSIIPFNKLKKKKKLRLIGIHRLAKITPMVNGGAELGPILDLLC